MKRILTILFILSISVSAFALDFSAGIGASAGYNWEPMSASGSGTTSTITQSYVPLSFRAFIDATYLEASVGYRMANGASLKTEATGFTTTTTTTSNKQDWVSIGALFKYPFDLGSFTLFPIVGIEYDLNLSFKDSSGSDLKASMTADQKANLDQFWIKAGIGADLSFGGFYIRPEVLIGYKLLSKAENDALAAMKAIPGVSSASITPLEVTGAVLVGFKF
jgi:hypothetical protein